MKLNSYTVRHYKSLSEVKVDFHPNVTLIVGPNSVGKSNFVDAMRFLRDAAKDGLDHATLSRGGITRIRQQTQGGGRPFNLGFEVRTTQAFKELPQEPCYYILEVTSLKGGEYKIEREDAECFEEVFHEQDDNGTYEAHLLTDGFSRARDGSLYKRGYINAEKFTFKENDRLALGALVGELSFSGLAQPLQEFFKDWRFTTLYPTILRELKTPDSETSLREDGSNWASVLRAARKTPKGRQNIDRINEMMRLVLPDFLDVSVTAAGSYLVPKFRFGKADSEGQREFDPVQLSDGTLRIYGILLSLYQLPPPRLLVIEEPEQTVHPGVLAMLAEAFKEVSEETQIVITSHSPQLVDHFDPDNIRVVTMKNGVTTISPIKKTQREAVRKGLIGLGEFMAAEGLQPDAVDE